MLANSQNVIVKDSPMINVGRDYIMYNNPEEILGKFKKWLDPPDPSINHNNARNKYFENTGQWLLDDEKYLTWKQQPNSLMWINGISGCGKTLICSTIIENIKAIVQFQAQPETGLVYFYFDIGDRKKQTTRDLLSHLVLALTARSKNYSILESLYEKHDKLYSPTQDELLGLLKELLNCFKQNYVVIDALDECDEYEQLYTKVIMIIHGWQLSNVHLLMTSRREQHILLDMQECATMEICLSAELVRRDITSYIHAAVGAGSSFKMWSHAVKEHVKEVLESGANGMFRWVACQIEELKLCQSKNKLENTLNSLPKDLEATYDQILKRINPGDRPFVNTVLQWLVFGMRPLTTEELATVVTFDPSSGKFYSGLAPFHHDYVIHLCTSLVTKTPDNSVRLAHASVKEYFLARQSTVQDGDIGLLETGTAHWMIAYCCVKYLLQDEWYNTVKLADFPLVHYACQYWPNHYKLSKEDLALHATVVTYFESEDELFNIWVMRSPGTWELDIMYGKMKKMVRLHYAALFGLESVVKKLIKNKNSVEEYSMAVQIAAKEGNTGTVKLLLDTVLNGDDQLQVVSDKGSSGIVKLLLDRVPTNRYTKRYGNALIAASLGGHSGITKILLDNGADLNVQGGQYGNALQAASYTGSSEVVKILVENGADVNAGGGQYGNALQASIDEGSSEVVKILLENGADVNASGGQYGNALQAASCKGSSEVVKILLENGADVNAQGGNYGNALQAASYEGSSEVVKMLLENGAYVKAQGGEYGSALQAASYQGFGEVVKILLDHGADVNAQVGGHGNALQAASYSGSSEVVKILLENGEEVNAQGGQYGNALQAASYKGSSEVVKILLDHGADVNAQGGKYGNALQAASCMGSSEVVKILLETGADVNVQQGQYGSALQAGSYKGSSEVVKILLDHGADVNVQGGEYGNALQAASHRGSSEVVKILLENGADVNAQGGQYGNALQAASYKGSSEVAKILLENGADVNVHGGYFGNALQAASYQGCSSEVVKILLEYGADVNTQGGECGNALQAASYQGSNEIVNILLENGADVNAQGGQFGNALQAASYINSSEVVEILLIYGADVNAQGGQYGNALQAASYIGSSEVVKILLGDRADVNAQGGQYGNALQAASYGGSSEVVEILLEHGADVNAQGGEYGNALQAASYSGSSEVVDILLEHGADVNAQGGQYDNALQAASYSGSSEVVKILLQNAADVNAQGGEYANALQAASHKGSIEVVRFLLENRADVNAQGGQYASALQAASCNGSIEIVKTLLENRADVNVHGGYFGNALQAASYKGCSEVVKILLDKGAYVNACGGEYGNPLLAASYEGSSEVVKVLLQNGADVNVHGGEYGNALQAASYGGFSGVVKILLETGADVNAQGGEYGNALQAASYEGSSEVVKILLDHGADVSAQGGEYGNALQAATSEGSSAIVKILLESGADVNAQGGQYDNALQAASYEGSTAIVKILLDHGADVNAQGGEYGNALQAASYGGSTAIVKILLGHGADVNAQGGEYGNALQAASYEGSSVIVKILLEYGADVNTLGGQYGNALLAASYEGHAHIVQLLLDTGGHKITHILAHAMYIATFRGDTTTVNVFLDKGVDINTPCSFLSQIAWVFPEDIDIDSVPSEFRTGDTDSWSAVFNPIIKRMLDIQLVHKLIHDGPVSCIRFSLDGKHLATAFNKTTQIYEVNTGVMTCVLIDKLARGVILSLCFSPDSKLLASGTDSYDKKVRVWDIAEKHILFVFDDHQAGIFSLNFSFDGSLLVSGSMDSMVKIWDVINTGTPCKVLTNTNSDPLNDQPELITVALSPNQPLVAAGFDDTTICIWDATTGALVEQILGHQDPVCSIVFMPDGKTLVSSDLGGTVKFWNVKELLSASNGEDNNQDAHIQTGNSETSGKMKREETMTCIVHWHGDPDVEIVVSPDGQWVMSCADDDNIVQLWDARSGEVQFMLSHTNEAISCFEFCPTGGLLATGGDEGEMMIWSYGLVQH